MTPSQIMAAIEEYSTRTGLSISTICLRATGNARLADRMRKRVDSDAETGRKVMDYIRQNPPSETPEGDAA